MPKEKLSAKKIEALERINEETQTFWFDETLKGFGVRISAKAKTYIVQCRVKGRSNANGRPLEVKESLGRVQLILDNGRYRPDAEQFEAVRKRARFIIDDAKIGITLEDRKQETEELRKEKERLQKLEAAKDITFETLVKQYIEARTEKGKLKPSTAEQYSLSLKTHCADWFELPARDITKDMIERRHLTISKRQPVEVRQGEKIRGGNNRFRGGKGTADATMRVVRAVINYGVAKDDIGALTNNPVNVLKASGWFNLGRRESSITTDQLKAWFAGLEAIDNPAIKLMMQISIFTGARKSEITSLRWSDVDIDADPPYAVFRETKNRKQLLIPLAGFVVDLIRNYQLIAFSGPDGFLFPSNGASGHIRDPRKQIRKAIEVGGVQFMPHDSRRTFLSLCNHDELRIEKWTQKRLCNHALPQDVTEGYVNLELKSLQATVERIAVFILKHAGINRAAPSGKCMEKDGNVVSLNPRRRSKKGRLTSSLNQRRTLINTTEKLLK